MILEIFTLALYFGTTPMEDPPIPPIKAAATEVVVSRESAARLDMLSQAKHEITRDLACVPSYETYSLDEKLGSILRFRCSNGQGSLIVVIWTDDDASYSFGTYPASDLELW